MNIDQGAELHFCSTHSNWYSLWKLTTKSDSACGQYETFPGMTQETSPKIKSVVKSPIYRKTTVEHAPDIKKHPVRYLIQLEQKV